MRRQFSRPSLFLFGCKKKVTSGVLVSRVSVAMYAARWLCHGRHGSLRLLSMSGNFHFLSRATTRSGASLPDVGIGPEAPRASRDPLYSGKHRATEHTF